MGTKNNPGSFDCYLNADPDEPMFVLLGRDPIGAALVRLWAASRPALNKPGDAAKIAEATACAAAMEAWCRKVGREPRSLDDARVEHVPAEKDESYAIALHSDGTSTDMNAPYCKDCGSNDIQQPEGALTTNRCGANSVQEQVYVAPVVERPSWDALMQGNHPPLRLHLRDTGLHDDMGGGGQRIWTTAGRGYEKTWFIEEAPIKAAFESGVPPKMARLDRAAVYEAAQRANTDFRQWMPKEWLDLFVKHLGDVTSEVKLPE